MGDLIGKAGKPLVRMIPYAGRAGGPRQPGSWRGRVVIHDDFDDLPPEIADAFSGHRP